MTKIRKKDILLLKISYSSVNPTEREDRTDKPYEKKPFTFTLSGGGIVSAVLLFTNNIHWLSLLMILIFLFSVILLVVISLRKTIKSNKQSDNFVKIIRALIERGGIKQNKKSSQECDE